METKTCFNCEWRGKECYTESDRFETWIDEDHACELWEKKDEETL